MRRRLDTEINAGSMADIAFLLLIFFLVATTFIKPKGIIAKLPPYYQGPPAPIPDRWVFDIKINSENQLLVEDSEMILSKLKDNIISFIESKGKNADKVIISFQNDEQTSYESYLQVYSVIKEAYKELRNDKSNEMFGNPYDLLSKKNKSTIVKLLPIKISETEPYFVSR